MTAVVPADREVDAFIDAPLRLDLGQAAGSEAEKGKKTAWLSPILWPYVEVNGKQQFDVLQFSPEHFRFWGYTLFLMTLVVGQIITVHFAWAPDAYEKRGCEKRADCPLNLSDPFGDTFMAWDSNTQEFVPASMGPLQAAYGYVNPCAYLDFPPANQILPLIWVFTMLCFVAGFFFGTIRCRTAVQVYEATHGEQGISPESYRVLRACCIWETFAYASFSLCFAVSPIAVSDKGSSTVMAIHTVPFILLELANWSHALTDLWYESASGYLKHLEMPCVLNAKVGMAYVITLSITTIGALHAEQSCRYIWHHHAK
jgi:hypothetical protein